MEIIIDFDNPKTLEEYNKELEEADAEIDHGKYVSMENLLKQMAKCNQKMKPRREIKYLSLEQLKQVKSMINSNLYILYSDIKNVTLH